MALAGFVAIWQTGSRGMGAILLALLIDAVILAYPAYLAVQYRKLPPIHDITTDSIDPPKFETLARLRVGDGANTAVYAGLYSAEQQRLPIPTSRPCRLDVPAQRAYEIALQLVTKRKWRIVDARAPQPPQPRRQDRGGGAHADHGISRGRRDPRAARRRRRSRVDIRSSSRYFESDLGSNAARVSKPDRRHQRRRRQPGRRRSRGAGQGAGKGEEVTGRTHSE